MVIKVKRIEKIINNKVFKGIAVGLKAITSTLIIIVISIIFIQRVSDNKVTFGEYSTPVSLNQRMNLVEIFNNDFMIDKYVKTN